MTGGQSAKYEILSRIRMVTRSAGQTGRETSPAWKSIARNYRQTSSLNREERLALLEERLSDYGAGVHRGGRVQIAAEIANILRGRRKQRIVLPADIDPSWLPEGFTYVADEGLSYEAIDGCDGVLTGATLAIASTGTIALTHGAGQGRRVLTLIPDYHLCLIDAAAVVETVPEGMQLLESYMRQPITLISGPSATADIEMTRIQGVHGPRVLDVLIVG